MRATICETKLPASKVSLKYSDFVELYKFVWEEVMWPNVTPELRRENERNSGASHPIFVFLKKKVIYTLLTSDQINSIIIQ